MGVNEETETERGHSAETGAPGTRSLRDGVENRGPRHAVLLRE
jgi:hypothetical protein